MLRKTYPLRFVVVLFCVATAMCQEAFGNGPRNATVLIIRHAEKPDDGAGLAPAGEARAKAYVEYFKNFKIHAAPVKLDAIFAAADSKNSRRPRITVEPLAQALGLPVNIDYKDKECSAMVKELQAHYEGKNILLCWHHGPMPELLATLGADSSTILPGGRWPSDEYDWVVVLRFDGDGHLKAAERIDEHLTGSRRD